MRPLRSRRRLAFNKKTTITENTEDKDCRHPRRHRRHHHHLQHHHHHHHHHHRHYQHHHHYNTTTTTTTIAADKASAENLAGSGGKIEGVHLGGGGSENLASSGNNVASVDHLFPQGVGQKHPFFPDNQQVVPSARQGHAQPLRTEMCVAEQGQDDGGGGGDGGRGGC